MNTNYKIESIIVLLNEDCVLSRYYPLIPVKTDLANYLKQQGVVYKDDCNKIADSKLAESGLLDTNTVRLFRRFLSMYDINPTKTKELNSLQLTADEKKSFAELYLLPGVKYTRASLYYKAGLQSLYDFTQLTATEIVDKCNATIVTQNLDCKCPLLKEVKTHIAVAKAFVG